jgi:hypothetical protein
MPRAVDRLTGEAATVVKVRIPPSAVHRLNRYLDTREMETGLVTIRRALIRHTLKVFLESKGIEGSPRPSWAQISRLDKRPSTPFSRCRAPVSPAEISSIGVRQQYPDLCVLLARRASRERAGLAEPG